jgi:hypothetical protein
MTADIRGKVGGLVFTRARNGTNIKARTVGSNQNTNRQAFVRAALSGATGAWNQLTSSERTSWSLLAFQLNWINSLGQAFSPTGQQLWTQAWCNAKRANVSPPGTAPGIFPTVPTVVTAGLTRYFSEFRLTVYSAGGTLSGTFYVYMSAPLSPGTNYGRSKARRYITGDATTDGTINVSAYGSVWGNYPPTTTQVAVRIVPVDPVSYVSGTVFQSLLYSPY